MSPTMRPTSQTRIGSRLAVINPPSIAGASEDGEKVGSIVPRRLPTSPGVRTGGPAAAGYVTLPAGDGGESTYSRVQSPTADRSTLRVDRVQLTNDQPPEAGLNPTRTLSGTISTTGAIWVK